MTTKIDKLTPEQEALIPVYREKWRAIALSTERIDRQKTQAIIKSTYKLLSQKEPDIFFFDSPYEALKQIDFFPVRQSLISLKEVVGNLPNQLKNQLSPLLWTSLWRRLGYLLSAEIMNEVIYPLTATIEHKLEHDLSPQIREQLTLIACIGDVIILDFLISYLSCEHHCCEEWEILQAIMTHCPWVFSFQEICFICDRPTKVSFDSANRLHAEGEPAIQFADGFSVYAHHGKLIQV